MSRLTKKDISGNYDLTYENGDFVRGIMPNEKIIGEIYINGMNKLGKLEDLEDELGCPLDVVFKAFKSFYCTQVECDDEVHSYFVNGFTKHSLIVRVIYDVYNESHNEDWLISTSDYKKTWWLKEDLSE